MEQVTHTPQELWRTEFDKQNTDGTWRDLVKRTTALAKRYERFTPRRSTDTPMDRINAALLKLFDGSRRWDPTRVDLCGFLLGVISSDLSSEMRRAKLVPQISFDDRPRKPEDDYSGDPIEDNSASSRQSIEGGFEVPVLADSVDSAWSLAMKDLHHRAADEPRVLALLGCYEEGIYQRGVVMRVLGWAPRVYKEAYRRLIALADAADPVLREAIAHALSN